MEFGLIVVPLLVLLIGIIQFSIWFWAYQVGAHAAREGARVAAVAPCNTSSIQTRITDRVGSAADGALSVPAPTYDKGADGLLNPGDQVTVKVSYAAYDIGLFPGLPSISKSATARIEHVPTPPGAC